MSVLFGRKERMHNFTSLSQKLSDFAGYFTRSPTFPSGYYNEVCIYLIYTVQDLIRKSPTNFNLAVKDSKHLIRTLIVK